MFQFVKNNLTNIVLVGLIFLLPITPVFAQNTSEQQQRLIEIQQEQLKVQQELYRLGREKKSLNNQISAINNQIKLTELKIKETQAKLEETQRELNQLLADIIQVTNEIDRLQESLDELTVILANRIKKTYISSVDSPVVLFFSSHGFSSLVSRLRYLGYVQEHDKKLLAQIQTAKTNYGEQKNILEEKQRKVEALKKKIEDDKASLEKQKTDLSRQRAEKERFLAITRNDEQRFQQLLAQLTADANSIARALGNVGIKIGPVNRGDIVAGVGSSGCSTGPHLHFEVMTNARVENGQVIGRENKVDPKPYLDNGTFYKVLDNYDGRSWTDGGSITTYFNEFYNILGYQTAHTGLDITASLGTPIHAADTGEAYLVSAPRPSTCKVGTPLGKGIIIDHKNGIVTLYWHIP